MNRGSVLPGLLALVVGVGVGWWWGAAPGHAPATASVSPDALEEQVAAMVRNPDLAQRDAELFEVFEGLGPETVDAVRRGLERDPTFLWPCTITSFASAWHTFDLDGALEWSRQQEMRGRRSTALQAIAYAEALDGRSFEARSWISGLTVQWIAGDAYSALAFGQVRADGLEEATDLVRRMNDNKVRDQTIEAILRALFLDQGPEAALAWVDSLPADGEKTRLLKNRAFQMASHWIGSLDPVMGAAWYERQKGEPYVRGAVGGLVQEWVEMEPERALEWLLKISAEDPSTYERAIGQASKRFADTRPARAERWLKEHAGSVEMQDAIPALVQTLKSEEPIAALVWTQRVENSRMRDSLADTVIDLWVERDRSAVETWGESPDLDDETRDRIATKLEESAA